MCSRFHRDEDATTTVGTNVVLGAARFGHGKSELGWRSGRVQFWRNASIGGHGLPDRSGLGQQGAGAANGENKHANDVQVRRRRWRERGVFRLIIFLCWLAEAEGHQICARPQERIVSVHGVKGKCACGCGFRRARAVSEQVRLHKYLRRLWVGWPGKCVYCVSDKKKYCKSLH